MRVSLLRAAKYPDPDADHGRHTVTISVLPHGPGLHDVLHEAEALNVPLRVVTRPADAAAPAGRHRRSPRRRRSAAVKHADDGSGDLIVRLYEACGDRATSTVRTPSAIRGAVRCNVLEEPRGGDRMSATASSPSRLRPFELVTLRLLQRAGNRSVAQTPSVGARVASAAYIARAVDHRLFVEDDAVGVVRRRRGQVAIGRRAAEEHHRPGDRCIT